MAKVVKPTLMLLVMMALEANGLMATIGVGPHLVTLDGFDHLRAEELHFEVRVLIS